MARGPGKGVSGNPNGRPKGIPNKSTKEAREMFVKIMNGQIDHIAEAMEAVRKENPVKYLDVLSKLFQYSMPKQIDLTTGDEPINEVKVTYIDKIGDNRE